LIISAFCIAYANGANDNFGGVITLFGSGTTNYPTGLVWATLTTLRGSLATIFFAEAMLKIFSDRGIIDDQLVRRPQ
jgi:PiT family inorganic phosphate transporter